MQLSAMGTRVYQRSLQVLSNPRTHRIRINLENILVKGRINTDYIAHLMEDLELQRIHRCIEVHSVEVVK